MGEIAGYVSLGLVAMLTVALVVTVLSWRSAASSRDDLSTQLIASVRSDSQRAIDDQAKAAQIAQLQLALQASTARADALQEFISHEAKQTDPSAGLAPDDVAGRVLRLSQRWGASVPAAGDPPRPAAAAPVRDAGAAKPT